MMETLGGRKGLNKLKESLDFCAGLRAFIEQ